LVELLNLDELLQKDRLLLRETSNLKEVSIAVIGFGKMGLLHSAILNLYKPNSVKFIVDKSRIITIGGSLIVKNTRFVRDLEKLLNEDIDAAYVTTPAESHYSITKRLLEAGVKAAFVEKPPTIDLSSFNKLLDHAKGRLVMVGFQKRYALPFRHVKLLLERGVVGDVKEVQCYIKSSDILKPTTRFNALGRGVLLDLGIHLIDLLSWLFGELTVEYAKARSLHTSVDDVFEAVLNAGGFSIRLKASWSDPGFRLPETMIEVKGDKGGIRVTEDYVKISLSEGSTNAFYKPHYYRGFPPVLVADPEYTIEDMHFLGYLATGRMPETSIESCEATMRLTEELYRKAGVRAEWLRSFS